MFVSSIIQEAKDTLGKCSDEYVFKRITDACRLANNQGKFDIALGQMDICVCDGCVTLPAEVGTVLAVNNCGLPTLMRDQWFQYHINGSGNEKYVAFGYTDEIGYFVTFKDPNGPVQLIAETENPKDSGKTLRVFGFDENNKRIYTPGKDGVLEDGFEVPLVYGFSLANPDAPYVARIDRIQKEQTNGFVKLIAISPTDQTPQTLIGYYLPWETEPIYRRLRVQSNSWVRVKYKRKDLEVRSTADWINIDNREALLLLLRAVKLRLDNQFELARASESEGMRLMSNEAEALRPPGLSGPQIIMPDGTQYYGGQDRLYY